MARAFNLTAEINLRGPANIRTVVADIRRQLGSVDVNINPRLNPASIRNINTMNTALRALNGTLAVTTTNAQSVSAALTTLGQSFNNVIGRNTQQGLNNAAQNINNVGNNAGRATTQMQEFGRQSALAVRRFAAFTVVTSSIYAFTGALRQGISDFIAFDKEFVRLQQVTGESAKSLQSLSRVITDLSVGLGVSSQELTTVAVTLAQAGLSAADTRKSLKALALSALAPSFDDMNQTVEGSIALMRQFDISAGELESALGSINAVAAKFAVEASDIITAIQRTGGVFATASKGVSQGTDALNEFVAIFTSVRATTRESAETIATGLRTIFTRIQRAETIQALEEFGVKLTDLEGKFVGPYEAVRRLSEGLSRLDPRDLQFSQIVEELGGFRQIGKVIPLIQQFAVAQEALKTAQTGQASLSKDAATAQLSIANQIAKVREEFTALIRSIGESDSFRSFVTLSLQLASALIKLADAAKIVLPALTALATIRGLSALTQFSSGFAGAFGAAGGARGLGQRLGGGRRFASGGLVPGSGNRDTVSAMLTPGEFVIRKKAVESIGASNLHRMNRYAGGGSVSKNQSFYGPNKPGLTELMQKYPSLTENQARKVLNGTATINKYIKSPPITNPNIVTSGTLASRYGISFMEGTLPPVGGVKATINQILKESNSQGKQVLLKAIGSRKIQSGAIISSPNAVPGMLSNTGREIFRDEIEAGIPALFDKATMKFGAPLNPGKVSLNQLISNSAIQSMKGQFFEAFARRVSQNIITDPDTDPIFDFNGAQNIDDLKKLFGGKFTNPNEFKVSATQSNIASAMGKALANSQGRGLALSSTPIQKTMKFAAGGNVDSVPAMLTPGEFVINKRAAKKIGSSKLHTLNRADKIQGFNKGGMVGGLQKFADGGIVQKFFVGGVVASLGRVLPLLARVLPSIQRGFITLATTLKGFTQNLGTASRNITQTGLIPSGRAGTRLLRDARSARAQGYTGEAFKERMRNRGGMGGMGGFVALTAGGAAIEGVSSLMGGSQGAAFSAVGGDVLNYGAIGATIGSIIPGFGTALGALTGSAIGLVTGFFKATAAVDEFNENLRQKNIEVSGAALSDALDKYSKNIERGKAEVDKYFEELTKEENRVFNVGNFQTKSSAEIASTQKYGAEAATRILEIEMMSTGKTFEELRNSMDPDTFWKFTVQIAETSPEYIQKLKELNATTNPEEEDKINAELREIRLRYAGISLAAKDNEVLEKRRADEAAKIVKEIDKTLDIYRRANAYADKYAASLERLVRATDARVNDFSNAPKVQNIDRSNEEVLGNLSAFSFEEVRAAAGGVAGLAGGSPEAKALADQAVASKILADQLPALVKSTSIENRGSIVGNVEKLFEAQGIDINTTEIQGVLLDIGNRLKEAASDTNVDKLTEELEQAVVGPLSKKAEEGSKLLARLAKTYNDTLQTAVDLQNQYNEALAQSNEYIRKAGIIRINAELELSKALGNSPTLQQLNEPFEFEIKDLTRGLRDVGGLRGDQATDPAAIGLAMIRTSKENARLEAETAANLAKASGLGADEGGNAQRAELAAANLQNIASIGKNKLALDEGRKALEKLANDGTKAANALAKIQEQQQKIEGFGNFLQKIATADFDELFQMNRESAALAAARAGGPEFMGNLQNRQLAFAGLESQRELYSPEEFRNIRADLLTKFYESQGFNAEDFVPKLGMTLADAMERIRGGVSEQDPNVIAYRDAVNEQIKANEVLGLLNKQQALIIQESMLDLQIFLAKDFPNILIQALADARADAGAANPRNLPPVAPGGDAVPVPAGATAQDIERKKAEAKEAAVEKSITLRSNRQKAQQGIEAGQNFRDSVSKLIDAEWSKFGRGATNQEIEADPVLTDLRNQMQLAATKATEAGIDINKDLDPQLQGFQSQIDKSTTQLGTIESELQGTLKSLDTQVTTPIPTPVAQDGVLDRLNAERAQLQAEKQAMQDQIETKIGEMPQTSNVTGAGSRVDRPLTQLTNPSQIIPAPIPPGVTPGSEELYTPAELGKKTAPDVGKLKSLLESNGYAGNDKIPSLGGMTLDDAMNSLSSETKPKSGNQPFVEGENAVTRAEKGYAPTPERKAFVMKELKDARQRQRLGQKLPTDDSVISASTFELRNLQNVKLPTETKPLTPFQQMMASRRQEYLSRFRPEVRERMMTKAEKEAMRPQVAPTTATPAVVAPPTTTGPGGGPQVLPTTGGPTGGTGFQIQLDPASQGFLDTLQNTFNGFNTYIDRLAAVATTIPSKIELVGNYVLDVQISGAAAFDALEKRMKELAVALVEPKLKQLRDEVSSVTGGQVKSSASMGSATNQSESSSP